VIGKLFGTNDSDRQRTELIVLITPRVIRDRNDASTVTRDLIRRYEGVLDSLGPRKKTRSLDAGAQPKKATTGAGG
jgi:general secretion pathway protein D